MVTNLEKTNLNFKIPKLDSQMPNCNLNRNFKSMLAKLKNNNIFILKMHNTTETHIIRSRENFTQP